MERYIWHLQRTWYSDATQTFKFHWDFLNTYMDWQQWQVTWSEPRNRRRGESVCHVAGTQGPIVVVAPAVDDAAGQHGTRVLPSRSEGCSWWRMCVGNTCIRIYFIDDSDTGNNIMHEDSRFKHVLPYFARAVVYKQIIDVRGSLNA